MFRLHKGYLLFAIVLLLVEIVIGFFVHDRFVRPYVGDFLVVILLYCFVKSFFILPINTAAILVLLFAYAVEVAQFFHLVQLLGLDNNKFAKTIIGSSFEWSDMLAYTLGISFILLIERFISNHYSSPLSLKA